MQTISRKALKELYDLPGICAAHKSKIETYLKKDLFAESIEVSDEDVSKAYSEANADQVKVLKKHFKKVSAFENIQNYSDILDINKGSHGLRGVSNAALALDKLIEIAKAYNGDWKPDWDNTNQLKFYIYKYRSGGRWCAFVHCDYDSADRPSGVYFKSKESALDSYEKFQSTYDEYFMI